jgi:hypothetical protein
MVIPMRYIPTYNDLVSFNQFLCRADYIELRDMTVIDRIVDCLQSLDNNEGFRTSMATAIMHGILRERPFFYHNRETALLAVNTTMIMNECIINTTCDEYNEVAEAVEQGNMTREQLRLWIIEHYRTIEPIKKHVYKTSE